MAHKEESRTRSVGATMDQKSFEQFKKYGRDLGMGHCLLGTVACYIILGVLKDVDMEIQDEYNKGFKEIISRWNKWPEKFTIHPVNDLFRHPSVPDEIREQIFRIILQQAKTNGNNHKKEEEVVVNE